MLLYFAIKPKLEGRKKKIIKFYVKTLIDNFSDENENENLPKKKNEENVFKTFAKTFADDKRILCAMIKDISVT